jgi:hypothetical protein
VNDATFNASLFNESLFNDPDAVGAIVIVNPLAIDDRAFDDATWEDDRTLDDATWEDFKTIDLPNFTMTVKDEINPIAKGDARTIRRTYRKLPTGSAITKAWLTVKKQVTDPDVDALIMKEITDSPNPQGQITKASTDPDGQISMFFEFTQSETDQAGIRYFVNYPFDIQILRSTGQPHTLSKGYVSFFPDVTRKNT